MQERQIIDKLNKENKDYVPDLRDSIVRKATAKGILNGEEYGTEVLDNGNGTALASRKKGWVAAVWCTAIVLVASLVIALASVFGNGNGVVPPVKPEMSSDYSVGAVATAKLMNEYFGGEAEQAQSQSAKLAKTSKSSGAVKTAARSSESGIENFGVYFSAFDSFFADDMLTTVYNPIADEDYENEAVIYGKYANGYAAEFTMAYNEILDLNNAQTAVNNYILKGYISLGYNSGYVLEGSRTLTLINGAEVQTALEIRAYRNADDKTNYAKMELTDAGYKFTVVLNGQTESEALMYRPAGTSTVAYVVDIVGENGGTFTVGMPSEGRDEVTVDCVNGSDNMQFYMKKSNESYGLVLCDYLVYKLSADKTYWSVYGYDSEKFPADGTVVIPAYVQGKPVKEIGRSAFYNSEAVTVIIPDTVESLGDSAFSYSYIEMSKLVEVVLPSAIKSLPALVFYNCDSLEKINIPDSIEEIGRFAFGYCSKLTNFSLPANLVKLNEGAFSSCGGYEDLYIPQTILSIGAEAFSGWANMQTITVDPANANYKSVNNCLIEISSKTLITGFAGSVIPDDGSVVTIGKGAFYKSKVKNINIPASVTKIGYAAFNSCKELTQITFSYNANGGVAEVGDYAFTNCEKLESITLPASLEYIGFYAFNWCSSLTQINLPDRGIKIREDAFFSSAYFDNKANWQNDTLYIGKHLIEARNYNSGDLIIKSGTYSIAGWALKGTFNKIVFNPELQVIGDNAMVEVCAKEISFSGESEYYTVKNNCLIDIKEYKMIGSGNNPVIPDDGSVRILGAGAVSAHDSDEPFIVPECIREIEERAFCGSYTEIIVLARDLRISPNVFGNRSLKKVTFKGPAGIDIWAFSGCEQLESVTFEEWVHYIGDGAFSGCTNLKEIRYNGTMDRWLELTSNVQWYDEVADITVICIDGRLDKWGHQI